MRIPVKEGAATATSAPKSSELKSPRAPQHSPLKCSLRNEPARLSAHEMTLEAWTTGRSRARSSSPSLAAATSFQKTSPAATSSVSCRGLASFEQ